jgi:hypothetical protein
MDIRDRIKDFRRVKASTLRPSPKNWRAHPKSQQDALRGVLSEVGYADALLCRELADGALELIDGHLRAETTPNMEVPVLVLDVDEREADYILATHDPLAAMAEAGEEALAALLQEVESGNPAVQEMLAGVYEIPVERPPLDPSSQLGTLEYRILITCRDEAHHAEVLAQLEEHGIECKVLIS